MNTRNKTSFCVIERGRRLKLTASLPSVDEMSGKCGILNISQSYRPLWHVTWLLYLLFFCNFIFTCRSKYLQYNVKHEMLKDYLGFFLGIVIVCILVWYVRFEVFTVVTEECRLLGCEDVWLF
jgi:hypothetical protein